MNPALVMFLSGMLAAGYLVAAAFFHRFWKQTGDRFFVFFALAFALLAVQRVLLISSLDLLENKTWAYSLRLLAFTLIIYGIVAKNRQRQS